MLLLTWQHCLNIKSYSILCLFGLTWTVTCSKKILANCNLSNFGSCNRCRTKSILKIKEEWMMSQQGEKTLLHHVIRSKEENLISMSTSLSLLILLASTQKLFSLPYANRDSKAIWFLSLYCFIAAFIPVSYRPGLFTHWKSPRERKRFMKSPHGSGLVFWSLRHTVRGERKNLVRNTRKAGMWRKASWAFYALVTEKNFILFDLGLSLHATGGNWSTENMFLSRKLFPPSDFDQRLLHCLGFVLYSLSDSWGNALFKIPYF